MNNFFVVHNSHLYSCLSAHPHVPIYLCELSNSHKHFTHNSTSFPHVKALNVVIVCNSQSSRLSLYHFFQWVFLSNVQQYSFLFVLFVFICFSVEFLMTDSFLFFFYIKNNLFFSTGHLRQNCLWEKRQRKITIFNILTAALHEETSVHKFMFNSQWSLIKLLRCVLLGFWACIEKSFALAEFRLKLTFFFFSLIKLGVLISGKREPKFSFVMETQKYCI